jgi:hypothetical protein
MINQQDDEVMQNKIQQAREQEISGSSKTMKT